MGAEWSRRGDFVWGGNDYRAGDCVLARIRGHAKAQVVQIRAMRRQPHAKVVECRCLRWWWPADSFIAPHAERGFHPCEVFAGCAEDSAAAIVVCSDEFEARCDMKHFAQSDVGGEDFEDHIALGGLFYRFVFNSTTLCWSDPACMCKRSHTFPPRILDVFCGCGGLSKGFEMAGLPVQWAVERDKESAVTFHENHPYARLCISEAEMLLNRAKLVDCRRCSDAASVDPLGNLVVAASCVATVEPPSGEEESGEDEEESWGVREILDHRIDEDGDLEFFVAWVGCGNPTWAPLEDLDNCPELLERYYESHPGIKEEAAKHAVFVVETIRDIRVKQGKIQYKVRWKGFESKHDSWVDADDLDAPEQVERFFRDSCFLLPRKGDITMIMGGPPCQGASMANRSRNAENPLEDEHNRMMIVFVEYVKHYQPELVLFENVCGIFTLRDAFLVKFVTAELVKIGYQIRVGILQAGFYGVPQSRWRVLIWAAKSGIRLPEFPRPTHAGSAKNPPIEARYLPLIVRPEPECKLPRCLTIHDAISDLPLHAATLGDDPPPYATPPRNAFQRLMRGTCKTVDLHVCSQCTQLNAVWADDFESVDPLTHDLLPRRSQSAGTFDQTLRDRDEDDGEEPGYDDIRPLQWRRPFYTLRTHPSVHGTHPSERRLLTVRECARAQSLPDNFHISGSWVSWYRQLGNAVPSLLGRALAEVLFPVEVFIIL